MISIWSLFPSCILFLRNTCLSTFMIIRYIIAILHSSLIRIPDPWYSSCFNEYFMAVTFLPSLLVTGLKSTGHISDPAGSFTHPSSSFLVWILRGIYFSVRILSKFDFIFCKSAIFVPDIFLKFLLRIYKFHQYETSYSDGWVACEGRPFVV